MSVELVTGYAGAAHITAADDGLRNIGTFGAGKYVLDTGTHLECEVQSANAITIGTGDALFEGRHVTVQNTETVSIDNGAQGLNRNDIICFHYTRDADSGIEDCTLEVVKGQAASAAVDPAIPSGSIAQGNTSAYMPLWRIPIAGLTVGTPVKLYGNILPDLETAGTGSVAASRLTGTIAAARIPNISAKKITSDTLDAARIPSLDGSKIGSGTINASYLPVVPANKGGTGQSTLTASANALINALSVGTANVTDDMYIITQNSDSSQTTFFRRTASRLWNYIKSKADSVYAAISHTHSASDITSGALAAARVGDLPASKITSGTLDVARIPELPASKIASGTLAVARGGTGAATASANRVFAAPNGASGAPAFRALVADDIPALPASKLTSGVLAVARGGTGAATASANRVLASPDGASGAPAFRALVAADIPELPASKITSGTLAAARVGALPASKITSGTLDAARIPELSAAKITSGTLAAERVGALPASKITSGTLSADRIGALPASKITSGTLALARLPFEVLWETQLDGSSGEITLESSAANYTYVEVFYRTNDHVFNSVKIYKPNGKVFRMQDVIIDENRHMFVKSKQMQISGTTISAIGYAGNMQLIEGETPIYTQQASGFYITRVIGWR